MNPINKYSVLPALALLSACGGTEIQFASPALELNNSYNTLSDQMYATAATSDTVITNRSETAEFNGYSRMSFYINAEQVTTNGVTSTQFSGPAIVGNANILVDFAANTMTGTLDNFGGVSTSRVGITYTGSIDLVGDLEAANTNGFNLTLNGNLRSEDGLLSELTDVSISGDFRGTTGEGLYATGNMGVGQFHDNQNAVGGGSVVIVAEQ